MYCPFLAKCPLSPAYLVHLEAGSEANAPVNKEQQDKGPHFIPTQLLWGV